MTVYIALLVAIVGVVVFLVTRNNPDVKKIGYGLFVSGTTAFLIRFAGEAVRLLD